ncbi:hypothetical protein B4168_1397 [Anoxybacillus flavithermus]|nr:hypothetical protein B4168_1397 [Anoxybacillus flavithermus]OAO84054.1 hypothetical protein GT23_3589 [Parageobacillus thermoglucosidasius]
MAGRLIFSPNKQDRFSRGLVPGYLLFEHHPNILLVKRAKNRQPVVFLVGGF